MRGPVTYLGWLSVVVSAASACTTHVIGEGFLEKYTRACRQPVPGAAARVTQPPDPDYGAALNRALFAEADPLRRCYLAALAYAPGLRGRLQLSMQVQPDGSLRAVSVLSNTTQFPALACCAVDIVQRVRVPASARRDPVQLDFPLIFRTIHVTHDQPPQLAYASSRPDAYEVLIDDVDHPPAWKITGAASEDETYFQQDFVAPPDAPVESSSSP